MAVTMARILGAGRVVACGRRQAVLDGLNADATIDLSAPEAEIAAAFAREEANGFGVIVDYLWGRPAELVIEQVARPDVHSNGEERRIRFVSVGQMAGPDIALPSNALRGSRLELIGSGTGNFPHGEMMRKAIGSVLDLAQAGRLPLEILGVPAEEVGAVWNMPQDPDKRVVLTFGACAS